MPVPSHWNVFVHLESNLHVCVRGIKIKMALNNKWHILAEETSSLETANEVTALGGTTLNVCGKCFKIDMSGG